MALKLIALIKEPYKIFIYVAMHFGYFPKMKDETYVKLAYRAFAGKRLDLTNPQTYDEKLQWLKLYAPHFQQVYSHHPLNLFWDTIVRPLL